MEDSPDQKTPQFRKRIPIIVGIAVVLFLAVVALWYTQPPAQEVAQATQEIPTSLNDSLILYYTFNDLDPESEIVRDTSGQGNHGTWDGSTPTRTLGVESAAALFDGDSRIHTPLVLTATTTSISLWMNRSGTDPRPVLIGAAHALDQGRLLGLNLYASVDDIGPRVDISDTTNDPVRNYAKRVPPDAWHHLVVTFDGTDVFIYIDGVLSSSNMYMEGYIPHTCNLVIGDLCAPAARPAQPFTGALDEVRIYDRTLTAEEVRVLYNLGM